MKRRGPVKSIVGLVFQLSIDLFRFFRTYAHQLYSERRSQSPLKKASSLFALVFLVGLINVFETMIRKFLLKWEDAVLSFLILSRISEFLILLGRTPSKSLYQ